MITTIAAERAAAACIRPRRSSRAKAVSSRAWAPRSEVTSSWAAMVCLYYGRHLEAHPPPPCRRCSRETACALLGVATELSGLQKRADGPASGEYCSPKCRAAFSREQRVQAVAESSHLAHRELAAM